MKLNRVEVYPIIATIPSNNRDFIVEYDTGDGLKLVVSVEQLKAYFRNFYEWFLLKPDDDERTDYEFLLDTWNNYKTTHHDNWNMLFKALFASYDPIDNYDIHEDFTHTPDGVKDTVTTTLENDSGTDTPTSEHYVATYSGGEKAYEKTTTTGKTTTTQESEIKSTYTDTTHRHGNAGVMTTAEVIRQEAELRKTELAAEIVLGGFVNDYLMYFGGVE